MILIKRFAPYLEAEASIQFGIESAEPEVVCPITELLRDPYKGVNGRDVRGRIDNYIRATVRANMLDRLCMPTIGSGDDEVVRVALETVRQYENHPHFWKAHINNLLLHFTSAACSGNFSPENSRKLLQACLDAGADINCVDKSVQEERPINRAIEHHSLDIFEWFIQNGADLKVQDGIGNTPLHYAVSSGFSSFMALSRMVALGASTEAVNDEGNTPLEHAILLGRVEDAKTLLNYQTGVISPRYTSLLCVASRESEAELVSHVLEHAMSNPQTTDLDLTPALAIATRNRCVKVIRILVSYGAHAFIRYVSCWSCLHFAILHTDSESLQALLQAKNLHINQRCFGRTALELAMTLLPDHTCASILIDAGADVNLQNACGLSCLELAVKQPRKAEWKTLLAKIVLRITSSPVSFFETAIQHDDLELVSVLVEFEVLQDAIREKPHLPLHFMAVKWQARGKTNSTPLGMASDLIARIVEAGADPYHVDENSRTPLEVASLSNNGPVCLALLRLMGASHPQAQVLFKHVWEQTILVKSWACVCAFHQASIPGDTAMLSTRSGLELLQYAVENEVSDTLVLFMGSADEPQACDHNLHRVWKIVLPHVTHGNLYHRFKNWTSKESLKIPEHLMDHSTRLKSWKGGYSKAKQHFYEAHTEPGLKEVHTDSAGEPLFHLDGK